MSTTPDFFGLRGKEFVTSGAALGRIERTASRSKREADAIEADDYQRLAAALVEADDVHVSVDDIYAVGQSLGWSIARTELVTCQVIFGPADS